MLCVPRVQKPDEVGVSCLKHGLSFAYGIFWPCFIRGIEGASDGKLGWLIKAITCSIHTYQVLCQLFSLLTIITFVQAHLFLLWQAEHCPINSYDTLFINLPYPIHTCIVTFIYSTETNFHSIRNNETYILHNGKTNHATLL